MLKSTSLIPLAKEQNVDSVDQISRLFQTIAIGITDLNHYYFHYRY